MNTATTATSGDALVSMKRMADEMKAAGIGKPLIPRGAVVFMHPADFAVFPKWKPLAAEMPIRFNVGIRPIMPRPFLDVRICCPVSAAPPPRWGWLRMRQAWGVFWLVMSKALAAADQRLGTRLWGLAAPLYRWGRKKLRRLSRC